MAKKKKKRSYITTYIYDADLEYHSSSGQSFTIVSPSIMYILIEHDYRKRVMPVMYMKVKLLPSVYNRMVPDQGKGKLYFKLYREQRSSSTSSVKKAVIMDEFEYYMTDDPNTFKELDTAGEESGNSYKECHIGMIKSELQAMNQKLFQGVYKDTNMVSLVQNATKDMQNVVIQPFINNTEIKEFTCPAVSSVGQFLYYLNTQYSFYNGSYIYYLDFDKVYLRSNDGSYIDIKDGDNQYIAFDIRDLTKYQSFAVGLVNDKSQSAYVIYVSGSDAQIITDRESSELTGQVQSVNNTATSTDVNANIVDTSAITNTTANPNNTLIVNSTDPNAAKNASTIIAENAVTLIITKPDMDSRIFTPNKQYLLCNYEDNQAYCGIYYLVKKQEMYVRNGTNMSLQMNITLKKCADFMKEGSSTSSKAATDSNTSTADATLMDMPTNV